MDDQIRAAATAVRQQLEDRVAAIKSLPAMTEVLKLQVALNSMEDLLGEQKTTLSALFGLDTVAAGVRVEPDEFYGLDQLEAAKRYLKKFKKARPFAEIVEQVKAGGGMVEDERILRKSLGKSNMDVVKIGDHYGLRENYPHVKRGGRVSLRPSDQIHEDADDDAGEDVAEPADDAEKVGSE